MHSTPSPGNTGQIDGSQGLTGPFIRRTVLGSTGDSLCRCGARPARPEELPLRLTHLRHSLHVCRVRIEEPRRRKRRIEISGPARCSSHRSSASDAPKAAGPEWEGSLRPATSATGSSQPKNHDFPPPSLRSCVVFFHPQIRAHVSRASSLLSLCA